MMRKLGHSITYVALVVLLAPALTAAEWRIDPNHSAAQFAVKHMTVSTVRGHFGKMTGTVDYDPANPTAAKVQAEVDVSSVDTRNAKRDDHIRSPDFFDAAKYPTMTFKSTRVEQSGDRLKLIGNLTIRGVTREVTFDLDGPVPPVDTGRGPRTGATATTTINRKDFGMTWNRMIEAGGVTVGDEVILTIDVELTPPRRESR